MGLHEAVVGMGLKKRLSERGTFSGFRWKLRLKGCEDDLQLSDFSKAASTLHCYSKDASTLH